MKEKEKLTSGLYVSKSKKDGKIYRKRSEAKSPTENEKLMRKLKDVESKMFDIEDEMKNERVLDLMWLLKN